MYTISLQAVVYYNTLQHLNYSSMKLCNIIMLCVTMVKPLNVHVVYHRMHPCLDLVRPSPEEGLAQA